MVFSYAGLIAWRTADFLEIPLLYRMEEPFSEEALEARRTARGLSSVWSDSDTSGLISESTAELSGEFPTKGGGTTKKTGAVVKGASGKLKATVGTSSKASKSPIGIEVGGAKSGAKQLSRSHSRSKSPRARLTKAGKAGKKNTNNN